LSRGAEDLTDLVPRDACNAGNNNSVDYLAFAAGSNKGSALQEILLHRNQVAFSWLIVFETLGEFVGMVE
jgi:hypothetical protein